MAVAIEAKGLVKRFGSLVAVDGLDLEVRRGEILGLLGPNGAGKTTTIRMLTGLLEPTAGEVAIEGKPVRAKDARLQPRVGIAPQENVLWDLLTARENLLFLADMHRVPRNVATTRADELLARLGLTEKADARAGSLSGGMKRRLNVALALVHDPAIVVLDEPEAGLDPQARVVLREFVSSLAREKTVLVTTHNMDEAERMADRVAIVDHGRLIALDTPEGLKRQIGAGDVLEVKVSGDSKAAAERVRAADLGAVHEVDGSIVVRGLGLAQRFGDVLDAVRETDVQILDVRYRGNTLEDVFIALTGRALRE